MCGFCTYETGRIRRAWSCEGIPLAWILHESAGNAANASVLGVIGSAQESALGGRHAQGDPRLGEPCGGTGQGPRRDRETRGDEAGRGGGPRGKRDRGDAGLLLVSLAALDQGTASFLPPAIKLGRVSPLSIQLTEWNRCKKWTPNSMDRQAAELRWNLLFIGCLPD